MPAMFCDNRSTCSEVKISKTHAHRPSTISHKLCLFSQGKWATNAHVHTTNILLNWKPVCDNGLALWFPSYICSIISYINFQAFMTGIAEIIMFRILTIYTVTDGTRKWVKYTWRWHTMWQIRNMEREEWFMVSTPRRLSFGSVL